ncbi:Protein of uncharacterised function (DUF2634) [Sebaldella termitidis]|uniref:Phage protein n=1 Tax=Sebaldella termitidis (strain ATCC 33386 / NCTC 11300) TaxID=526218 RepID=D1AHS3_SEBTE|nr:DUF2634 domain-containing protein [Sebaldella termitidis]ACZ08307.1 hypothetical protein Sterm_1445 [Sebaldella termitidis ATCC 33386]SUI23616.1 Protein of uncharacterised function (DUF2634) [Sebaldella termitidis]
MVPKNFVNIPDINIVTIPTKTYKMELEENSDRISGFTDEQEAMKQAIYKIIRTERYKYIIYDWNYGIELEDLFGMPVNYCVPEIERRIREALLQDTRISEVNNFEFDTSKKGVVLVKFTAYTEFGEINIIDEEVSI